MKTDRLVGGSIAGVVGGIAAEIFGETTRLLHLTDRTFLDYASILYAFKPPEGVAEYVVAILLHLTLCGLLGVVFAYFVQLTSHNYYYFKTLGYSMLTWWLLGTTGSIWRLPLFKEVPPGPALITLASALVYGFVTAIAFKIIEDRTELI